MAHALLPEANNPNALVSPNALVAHPLFQSDDLDETRERVSQVFCPHELRVVRNNQTVRAHMYHLPIGGVSLNRLDYGVTVDIDAGRLEDFCLVMMPLWGVAEVSCGEESIRSNPWLASVITPTQPLRMQTHEGCDQVMIKIDRALLERHCAQHLGHDLTRPVEFRLGMPFGAAQNESWCRLIELLVTEAERGGAMLTSPLLKPHVEQMVVATLLCCQPHNYLEELKRPTPPIAPHYVKRAEDFIHSHADQPISVIELAEHAGVSTRALFTGFQNFRGISPMAYLKSVRLQRVYADLLEASPCSETVTAVAMRWGFTHLGHFTVDYRRKFGESPSVTLRRVSLTN